MVVLTTLLKLLMLNDFVFPLQLILSKLWPVWGDGKMMEPGIWAVDRPVIAGELSGGVRL